jgi:streptogramin lyase
MKQVNAEVLREYGPFDDIKGIHGVTFDGQQVWFASDGQLNALDPASGETVRTIKVGADGGTAFDGKHLYQIADRRIHKIDPATGRVLHTIPAPGNGGDSGMAWAEGSLWVGQYRERKIHQIDPQTGEILRTLESNRFVTGVTWVDGGLWHGTWEGMRVSCGGSIRRNGKVIESLKMPAGQGVSGLEADGADRSIAGAGTVGG